MREASARAGVFLVFGLPAFAWRRRGMIPVSNLRWLL
jgi:hypothetical protein